MASLLLTLLSIAIAIGADDISSKIQRDRSRSNHMSTDDILRTVNQVLDRANQYEGAKVNQLNKQLSILNSKLSAIPYNQSVGVVKEKIQQARRNINTNISKTQDAISDATRQESQAQQTKYDIQTRAQSLANASDSYKNSKSGEADLAQLKRDAQTYVNKIEQINKGVENYV